MYYKRSEKTDVTNKIISRHVEVRLDSDNRKVYYCKICESEIPYGKKHVRLHFRRHHFEIYLKYLRELRENQISIQR